jgi:NAD(P)-dependent dehydrogenase (short-subunit alcohol dehydrogenase family)
MTGLRLGLEGRVAVVTGASKGIGLAVVSGLVAEGAYVVAGARHSSPELDKLAAGGSMLVVPVDLAEPEGPATLVAAAGDRIDILVNNVGSAPVRIGGFLSVTDEQWLTTVNLNLMAAVRATRATLPLMLAGGRGAIVNVCSVNAVLPDPNVIDYSAAKAALANFSKALSKEYGEHNIRVNTVSPGPVMTDLWLGIDGVAATVAGGTGVQADDVVLKAAADAVLGRFTRPAEVADLVLLLASDRTANVTGADITVDGGLVPTW